MIITILSFSFSSYITIFSGVYTISVGILTLILCRKPMDTLTNLFILVFFQILFLILALVAYFALVLTFPPFDRCEYPYHRLCERPTNLIIFNFGIFVMLITLFVVVYSLIIITKEQRLRAVPSASVNYTHRVVATENI